jgi:chloride channel protein, CIC family
LSVLKRNRPRPRVAELADFTADSRMLLLSVLALAVGFAGAALAWSLLRLIYGVTNLFYFHRLSWQYASPGDNHLGWLAIFVPVIGGLLVGVVARFGSNKVRGHGIPEALEAILIHGARIEPSIAVLKPVASAIAIGSGGPFGAEGPIIMTAGAAGSLLGQLFRLSDAERATMLVAGASAGMAAVFSTPVAAILLAVELMLFEWRPRSLVPVAVASVTAAVLRRFALGPGPLFPMPLMQGPLSVEAAICALPLGVACGVAATLLSRAVYASEDFFEHLSIHWMWWPALGGIVVGIGGMIFPHALGTGYDVIGGFVAGNIAWKVILGVLVVKSLIWAFSLGSGTSGGIMAPLLMVGGAMGAAASPFLPVLQAGAWPLVGMAAVFGGAIGCPLTAAMMSVELTHNYGLLVPALIGAMTAHAVTSLIQKRSILTERLARRGHHVSREYGVDPLETMRVAEVMRTNIVVLPPEAPTETVQGWLKPGAEAAFRKKKGQKLYPVAAANGAFLGAIGRGGLEKFIHSAAVGEVNRTLPFRNVTTVSSDATLRSVAETMAREQAYILPVVEKGSQKVMGVVRVEDLLAARVRAHDRENKQLRVQWMRNPFVRVQRMEMTAGGEVMRGQRGAASPPEPK